MNGYIAFHKDRKTEVYANTTLEAQRKAAEFFRVKPNKAYEVSVVLAEKDGKEVVHAPLF